LDTEKNRKFYPLHFKVMILWLNMSLKNSWLLKFQHWLEIKLIFWKPYEQKEKLINFLVEVIILLWHIFDFY